MAFNDDIFNFTGGLGFTSFSTGSDIEKEEEKNDIVAKNENTEKTEQNDKASETNDKSASLDILSGITSERWSSSIGNDEHDYVIESDLVMPKIKAVKSETEKPLIVVVDDDFETLDLLEIYLKRNYTYESFSGPREAVFFLNQHTPELILIDCKIHTMKALTFIDIIRTGAGNENVPFVLVGTEEELKSFDSELLPKSVIGTMKKPIARGQLQEYIDKVVKKPEE